MNNPFNETSDDTAHMRECVDCSSVKIGGREQPWAGTLPTAGNSEIAASTTLRSSTLNQLFYTALLYIAFFYIALLYIVLLNIALLYIALSHRTVRWDAPLTF